MSFFNFFKKEECLPGQTVHTTRTYREQQKIEQPICLGCNYERKPEDFLMDEQGFLKPLWSAYGNMKFCPECKVFASNYVSVFGFPKTDGEKASFIAYVKARLWQHCKTCTCC